MLLALALALLPTATDVIDVGPGSAHVDIQSAVLAASEGDVIRVASGTYTSFAVHGKSLTIVPLSTSFDVVGLIRIQGLAARQTVVLEGARIFPNVSDYSEGRLVIGFNEGSVRIADVSTPAHWVPNYYWPGRSVRVIQCADLTFVDCHFAPAWGFDPYYLWHYGDGAVVLSDSQVTMISTYCEALHTPARASIECFDTELIGIDMAAWGSLGASSWLDWSWGECFGDAHGGSAGVGLWGTSTLTTVDSALSGGSAGSNGCNGPFYIPAAPPIWGPGTASTVAGPAVTFDAPHTVVESSVHTLELVADQADTSLLLMGPAAARLDLPGWVGSLLVTGPRGSVRRMVIGMGSVSYTFQAPTLPNFGVEQVHMQAVHLRPNASVPGGREVLCGAPRIVTVLDSAW